MKKLIALSAAAVMASSAAMADVAISGSASVSYDDNGSSASSTSYDADLSIVGTAGATTVTIGLDVDAGASVTGVDLSTSIGPITIAADMFNATEDTASSDDEDGTRKASAAENVDTSITVSLDVPVGDMTVALDDSGDITLSGTFAGVTISHTIQDGSDSTTGSASIAGMDISLTNDGGDSTWSIGTTVSGVTLTLDSENDVSAVFGLAGNTLTVTHNGARAIVAATTTHWSTAAVAAYSTVAISRDLTSGATLTATYSSSDDSLTLKAAVSF
jgi:hypothetical protein